MKVLVACEESGVVRDAFMRRGIEAWSCDLLPSRGLYTSFHFQGGIKDFIDGRHRFNLIIAHPPCTYLSNSGVCHLHRDPSRWNKMEEATKFFKWFLDLPCKHMAVENPIMHKYAIEIIGRRQDQVIQPWMFGHMEQKATCLWLKNLPLLKPTNNVKEQMMKLPANKRQRLHYLPPSPLRQRLRSETFKGIAEAMAEQWGSL